MNAREGRVLGNLLIEAGVHEIDILGGEPTLIYWVKDFVERMTGAGITINISTNGSLPEIVNELSRDRSGLMNIGFSLHGLVETHNALTGSGNFSKAVSGIGRMVEKCKNPIVKSVLTRRNMHEIYELVTYLKNLGVKRYFLLHEDVIGEPESTLWFSYPEFQKFYLKLRESFCGDPEIGAVAASGFYKYGIKRRGRCDAGLQKLAIMPDGSVFPCNLFQGFNEFRLGNIFRERVDEIGRSPVLDYLRRKKCNDVCGVQRCGHYSACTGGCPAHSYYFYKTLDAVDPRCRTAINLI